MKADDPRHGENAGYLTHYRDGERPCDACTDGRYRARKRILGAHLRGEQMLFNAAEVAVVVGPWLSLGFTPSAIMAAAGYTSQRGGTLGRILTEGGTFRRGTMRALIGITEADFHGNAKIPADLTRRRIYSLMAAGHALKDMPINVSGYWRTRDHITTETARDIRDHYQANEFRIGTSVVSRGRALSAGHLPPLSWDDPGTLAWPDGEPAPIEKQGSTRTTWRREDLLAEWDHLRLAGVTLHHAARQLGVTPDAIERAILRDREAS